MKIEIDSRPPGKVIIDGHEVDSSQIDGEYNVSVDTATGLNVRLTFRPDEVMHTGLDGVTWVATRDGAITISGPDAEAVRRAAGLT